VVAFPFAEYLPAQNRKELMQMRDVSLLSQTILPLSLHGVNPRKIMRTSEWNKIKKEKQALANHHCMCCGEYVSHVPGDWLECHEVYDIDLKNREFMLMDIVCLCKKCHAFIHQGRLGVLLSEGKVSREYYDEIIERGNKLLHDSNIEKRDLSSDEITNPNWCLVYNGKKYSNR